VFIFTNKRLILVDGRDDRQSRVPIGALQKHFPLHIETADHLDLDAELKIWVRANPA
jgi:hypothetical protein